MTRNVALIRARYDRSEKGLARHRRYNDSPRGGARRLRYERSAQGRSMREVWHNSIDGIVSGARSGIRSNALRRGTK